MWKKEKLKKMAAAALATGMMMSAVGFTGFAEEERVLPITVDVLEQNETDLLPVRRVAEHFGYTVGWKAEGNVVTLTKGAQYITFAAGQDAYTFSKTAPESLGAPSVIADGVTHVPVVFFTKLMGLNCHELSDHTYEVVQPSNAEIIEIQDDGRLLVNDETMGEVLVAITENTKLTADGEKMEAEKLEVGQNIAIEYDDAMTMSLPPQTAAVQISVLNLPTAEEGVAFSGTISEIGENSVTILSDETGNEICLIFSEQTKISRGMDKRIYKIDDLTVGMKISGLHAEEMTASLPPQTTVFSIEIAE